MTREIVGFLDLETTGIDVLKGHRIIEVAIALHDMDTEERLGKFVTRVNPQRSVDADATAVHGIKFEDLISSPLWEVVGPKVAAILAKCDFVVAHNGEGFDIPFVFHELIRVGAPLPVVRLVDTMLQARWATPDGAVPNLGALCFACGIPYDKEKAHGALYDVDVMKDCFFSQVDRGFFKLPTETFRLKAVTKEGL